MNNINMSVNGVNPATAMNAMANGTNGVRNAMDSEIEYKTKLNTYIYDYFLKNEQYDVARVLHKSSMPLHTTPTAPPRKAKGTDDGGEDSKDDIDTKKPTDLPYASNVPTMGSDNSFLLDWFQIFWEMWLSQQSGKKNANSDAYAYMQHTKAQNKLRQDQQSQILRQPGLVAGGMPPNYQNMMRVGQQGLMPTNEMARRAQQNNMRNMNPTQQQIMLARQHQMMQHQQMEREGSGVDMNGRPRSPSSGENAPSPSKRPRIEGQFPGQSAMANGRFGPGMPGQQMTNNSNYAQALLKQNDIDPSMLSPANFNTFQQQAPNIQKRTLDAYSQSLAQNARQNMPQGMNGVGGQVMPPNMEMGEFYNNNAMRQGMAQNGGGQGSSNHALQDYQMQLMLLEQQNKKRLLMARQEQDGTVRPEAPGMPGQPGFAPNMSPSNSRNGPSPNPSEQMKRGTPKLNQAGLPGSPMPTDMPHGRGSPGAMNFNNAMNLEMMQQMEGMKGMPMNQNGMRPPSSHPNGFNGGPVSQQQIEVLRQQAQARGGAMPNGTQWQQGPQGQAPGGVPQAAPSQNGQMGTPRAGNAAMPPPQNVPAANASNANNNNANGRPASPAPQPPAANTPQTTTKAAPSKKKTKENNKQPRKKNTATAATPSADAETTTPATPITPVNAKSFAENNKNNANSTQATTTQANANIPAPAPQIPQPQDTNVLQGLGDIDGGFDAAGMGNLAFSSIGGIGSMDTGDVLENFDFDAFLESGDSNEINFESLGYGNFDGVETALGEP